MQEDLTNVSFKDTQFLQMFGLSEHTILDYFSLSQFYDKSSLNEQIKMQARFNELQASLLDRRAMVGLEYDLWYFTYQPSLFVIRKQYRSSPTKVELMALYYVIEGTIYQAPDFSSLFCNRILTSLNHVQKAFEHAVKETRFHPSFGYIWSKDESRLIQDAEKRRKEMQAKATLLEDTQESRPFVATSMDEARQAADYYLHIDQLILNQNK